MATIAVSEARKDFAEMLRRAHAGERLLLTRNGKGVAALVPVEDLELIRLIEDRYDARAADRALAEVGRDGTISWEDAKAELGL